jgi:sRNA-binding protein
MMPTVTEVKLTCDVCGNANDVKAWTFGLDGQAYEIDLCRKDGNALGGIAAGYIAKARRVTAKRSHRQHGDRARSRAAAGSRKTAKARAAGSREAAKASRSQRPEVVPRSVELRWRSR